MGGILFPHAIVLNGVSTAKLRNKLVEIDSLADWLNWFA